MESQTLHCVAPPVVAPALPVFTPKIVPLRDTASILFLLACKDGVRHLVLGAKINFFLGLDKFENFLQYKYFLNFLKKFTR
jgi:hypothetical protein